MSEQQHNHSTDTFMMCRCSRQADGRLGHWRIWSLVLVLQSHCTAAEVEADSPSSLHKQNTYLSTGLLSCTSEHG